MNLDRDADRDSQDLWQYCSDLTKELDKLKQRLIDLEQELKPKKRVFKY